jgi:GAF domain-containing protein
MTSLGWILLGGAAWALCNVAVLALLARVTGRNETAQPEVSGTSEAVCRLAEDVLGVLQVERVAVVLHDPARPGTGVVEACCGRLELVGTRVPVTGGFGWGTGPESSFLIEDRFDAPAWSVVSVPIPTEDGAAGTVAVATSRERGLGARDVLLLERLSSRAASHSDRRPGAPQRPARPRVGQDRDIAA